MIAPLAALILAAASPAAPAAPAAPADAAATILRFADDLLDHGDAWRAEQEYARYLFVAGTSGRAAYASRRIAAAARREGDYARAAVQEADVATRWPSLAEGVAAAAAIGGDLEIAGRPADASDAYRAFAAAHPDDPRAPDEAELAVRLALKAHDRGRVEVAVPLATGTRPALPGLIGDVRASRPRHRSPAAAGVLAAILPGAGHAYAGEWKSAFASFVTNALFGGGAALAASKKEWAVAGVAGGAELFWYGGNVVGAVNAADRFNARADDERWRGLEHKWLPAPQVSLSVEF